MRRANQRARRHGYSSRSASSRNDDSRYSRRSSDRSNGSRSGSSNRRSSSDRYSRDRVSSSEFVREKRDSRDFGEDGREYRSRRADRSSRSKINDRDYRSKRTRNTRRRATSRMDSRRSTTLPIDSSDRFSYNGSSRANVMRYRPGFKFNVGYIVLLFIFIYLFICVVSYFTREHISIYEVTEKNLSENNNFVGLAIRNEEVISTDEAGYITYYFANGERVAANNMIFSIDEGGSAYKTLRKSLKDAKISAEDYLGLRNEIDYFKKGYCDSKFSDIYKFKVSLINEILDINTSVAFSNQEKILQTAEDENFAIKKSKDSGVVSYYVDDMTDISLDKLNKGMFDRSLYQGTKHKSGDLLEKKSNACRIVKDDKWKIVVMLNEEQYKTINDMNSKVMGVTFTKDNFHANARIEILKKDDCNYAVLTLNKYLGNYIDDRYIDIELSINTASGLKIPNTAIIDKEFYKIPYELFYDKDGAQGIDVVSYDSRGNRKERFTRPQIYYVSTDKDEKRYAYISLDSIEEGTIVKATNSNDEFVIKDRQSLKGVYNVNKGYCEFKKIDVLYSNSEYSIVEKENEYGLSKFDHIVCDAKTVDEKDIIY